MLGWVTTSVARLFMYKKQEVNKAGFRGTCDVIKLDVVVAGGDAEWPCSPRLTCNDTLILFRFTLLKTRPPRHLSHGHIFNTVKSAPRSASMGRDQSFSSLLHSILGSGQKSLWLRRVL